MESAKVEAVEKDTVLNLLSVDMEKEAVTKALPGLRERFHAEELSRFPYSPREG